MMHLKLASSVAVLVIVASAIERAAVADPFSTGFSAGTIWNTVYAQGFSPSESPNPDPGIGLTDPVSLTRFQFFKSGTADAAANIQLAIVNNFFLNLDDFTTGSGAFVGLSTNTIASTAGIATGSPITFNFDSLQLTYGENYAAIVVNNNGGDLTHVLVSSLTANYSENPPGSGMYLPTANYGDPDPNFPGNYFLATSNFTHTDEFGTFFDTFGGQGDAVFTAYFNEEAVGLTGDYNDDRKVDAGDYVLWRKNEGTTNPLANDPIGGTIDSDQYDQWVANFGEMQMPGGGNALGAVPEPGAGVLAVVAWLTVVGIARARRGG